MSKRVCAAAMLIVFMLLPAQVSAGKPAETLDIYLKQVFQIFQDYEAASITEQQGNEIKRRLSDLAGEVFNYTIMARMSLARHWRDFSQTQQKEFVRLFRQLLEENYFTKVLTYLEEIKSYSPENLAITDEIIFSERKAEVQTVISYEGKKVPVNYRFAKVNDSWTIYDISVEGVSLVQNYRGQFGESLAKSSPAELLEQLRSKVGSTQAEQAGGSS
jgi:phospholipid transport system substrate-binding protein